VAGSGGCHRVIADEYPFLVHILCVFAHPDDLELWAGGTMLLHADSGDAITSVVFYELNAQRVPELKASYAKTSFDFRALPTLPYAPIATDTTGSLLETSPDVVLTHWSHDAHLEHRLAFDYAVRLCHEAKRYQKRTPVLLMTTTYFGRGLDGRSFDPSIIVDISGTMIRKRASIAEHVSQHPEKLLADLESQNRLLGARIGTDYAEGFEEYPLFGMQRTARRASLGEIIRTKTRTR